MSRKNERAMKVAVVSGILLLIAGMSGVAAWQAVETFVFNRIGEGDGARLAFAVLIYIASFGGIAVIIGGLLIGRGEVEIGKVVIAIGAGMGLVGLVISLVISIFRRSWVIGGFVSIGGIGLLLSIAARAMAGDKKHRRKRKRRR